MTENTTSLSQVEQLADSFVARFRKGERPSISEYTRRYPELADEIAEVFPALVAIEQAQADFQDVAPVAADPVEPSHSTLGDFRIIREIARGGMGVVYEAEQVSLSRRVALKVLSGSLLSNEKNRKRFAREARAAAQLHHTNIVPVFGVGEQDDVAYYVMQLIHGLGLDEVLKEIVRHRETSDEIPALRPQAVMAGASGHDDCPLPATDLVRMFVSGQFEQTILFQPGDSGDASLKWSDQDTAEVPAPEESASRIDTATGRLSGTGSHSPTYALPGQREDTTTFNRRKAYWDSVSRIGMQVAEALEYAHEQGVCHRDIKPANLLLDTHGTAWVTDFGLAKAADQQDLTHTGDVIGTLRYMAPEQFEGRADARSDIYSFGLTLYELLALKPAFDQTDRHQLIKQVTECTPARLRSLDPSIPRDLETIVHKAIERDPSHRYLSARELADDLGRFLRDEPIRAKWVSPVTRVHRWCKRNPMGATVTVLLVMLAVGGPFVAAEQIRLRQEADDATSEASERAEEVDVQRKEAVRQTRLAGLRATEAEQAAQLARTQEKLARQQRDLTLRNLYVAHIRLAHEDWNSGHLTRMIHTLDAHHPTGDLPDFRGWEWYYLTALARKHKQGYRTGLGSIRQVKWSPDGRLVAIAGQRGVQIVEPVSQQVVQDWPGHQGAEWSADGSRFATVKRDQNASVIRVLSTANWEELHMIATEQSNHHVEHLSFTANGRSLAWQSAPAGFSIWKQGDENPSSFKHPSEDNVTILSMAWDPQGRFLAIGTRFRVGLGVWDSVEKRLAKEFEVSGRGITHISWSADGDRLATSSIDGDINVWDVAGERLLKQIGAHHGWAFQCDWSPDAKQIVSVGEDNLLRISSVESGQQISRVPGHRAPVLSVDWSPLGNEIVSGSVDGSVQFWQPFESQDALLIPGRQCVAWSPDGTRVVSNEPRSDNPITYSIRDSRSGQLVTGLESRDDGSMCVFAWSPDGKLIAGAGMHGTAHVWSATTGRMLHALDAHQLETRCVAWSPDNLQFATCGQDRLVKIWETSTGKLLREFSDHAERLGSVGWSPDGRWFASVDWGRDVFIRSTENWEIEWEIDLDRSPVGPGAGGAYTIAWSPDSQRLATIHAAGDVVVLRLRKEKLVQQEWSAQAHTSNIRSIAWSPDGHRIASGSEDRSVKIWDAENGRELLTLGDHAHMVTSVAWSPDGRRLASTDDLRVHIWDATEAYQQQDEPAAE